MKRQKDDGLWAFILIAFSLVFWGWVYHQKQQRKKIRAMRLNLDAENGFESDAEKLRGDWALLKKDLQTATEKVLADVT